MTTNDKEYQRAYQKEYRKTHPQKQYKKVKTEVKKVKILENLHPPIIGEKTVEMRRSQNLSEPSQKSNISTDSKPIIDFTRIANLSTFQRFLIEAIKISVPGFEGVTTRGKKETIAKEFNERASDYRLVMTELKAKLKELGKV